MWNSLTDKIIVQLHHKQDDSVHKTTVIQAICHKLGKRQADFFQTELTE